MPLPTSAATSAAARGGAPARRGAEPFSIRCGRCGVVFRTYDCRKLDHFSIYRVVCPHCRWPGRYLASELHAATVPAPAKATG